MFGSIVVHNRKAMKSYSYSVRINSNLFSIYHNKRNCLYLFRINVNVTLTGLKDQLNLCLNHHDTRRMISVDYHHLSIGNDESVCFTIMQLENDSKVRIMFSIFSPIQYQRINRIRHCLD